MEPEVNICTECGALTTSEVEPRTGLPSDIMHEAWHRVLTEQLQNLNRVSAMMGPIAVDVPVYDRFTVM